MSSFWRNVHNVNPSSAGSSGGSSSSSILNNYTSSTDPAATDDSDDGYREGSVWINKTSNTAYICTDDAVGAATWKNITGAAAAASSGVSGSVQFSDGAGGFNSNNANFFWNNVSQRLGVGNNTPTEKIDVTGNIYASGEIYLGASKDWRLIVSGADLLIQKNILGVWTTRDTIAG